MNNKSKNLDKQNIDDALSTIQENKIKEEKKHDNKKNLDKKIKKNMLHTDEKKNKLEDDNKEKKRNLKIDEEIETLNDEIKNLREEKLRLLAEMENLRKRSNKDKIDSIKYGSINLARDILIPHDNLSRAIDAVPEENNRPETINNLIDGLKIVQKEFMAILGKHGVEKIESYNKKFDHNYHQAIMEIETDESEEGYVVKEIQSGFTMHNRLLRPSMVGVSKNPKNKKKDVKTD